MKPEEIRKKTNKIDRELLVLLQERMGLALRARKFKETLSDPQQENDMLARAERLNLDFIKSTFTRRLLETIIEETKGEEVSYDWIFISHCYYVSCTKVEQ